MSSASSGEVQILLAEARATQQRLQIPSQIASIEEIIADASPGEETRRLLEKYSRTLAEGSAHQEKSLALVRAQLAYAQSTVNVLEGVLAKLNDDEYNTRRIVNDAAVESAFALQALGDSLIVSFPLLESFVDNPSKTQVHNLQLQAGVMNAFANAQRNTINANPALYPNQQASGVVPLPDLSAAGMQLNDYQARKQTKDVAFINAAATGAFNVIEEKFRIGTQAILDYEVGAIVRGLDSWYETEGIGLVKNIQGDLVPINSNVPGQMLDWMGTPFSWSKSKNAVVFVISQVASPIIVYATLFLLARSVSDVSNSLSALAGLLPGSGMTIGEAMSKAAAFALSATANGSLPLIIAGTRVFFSGMAKTARSAVAGFLYPASVLVGYVSRRVSSLFVAERSVPKGVRDGIDDDLAASSFFDPEKWLSQREWRSFRPPPSNLNLAEHYFFYQKCCAETVVFVKEIRNALAPVVKMIGANRSLAEYTFAFSLMASATFSVATVAKAAIGVIEHIASASAIVDSVSSYQSQAAYDSALQNTLYAMVQLDNELQGAIPYARFVSINFDAQMNALVKNAARFPSTALNMFNLLSSMAGYIFNLFKFVQEDTLALKTQVDALLKSHFRPTAKFTEDQRAFTRSLRDLNAASRSPLKWNETYSYGKQYANVGGSQAKAAAPGIPPVGGGAAPQPSTAQLAVPTTSAASQLFKASSGGGGATPLPNTRGAIGPANAASRAGVYAPQQPLFGGIPPAPPLFSSAQYGLPGLPKPATSSQQLPVPVKRVTVKPDPFAASSSGASAQPLPAVGSILPPLPPASAYVPPLPPATPGGGSGGGGGSQTPFKPGPFIPVTTGRGIGAPRKRRGNPP
jgi:hypothetical protein